MKNSEVILILHTCKSENINKRKLSKGSSELGKVQNEAKAKQKVEAKEKLSFLRKEPQKGDSCTAKKEE